MFDNKNKTVVFYLQLAVSTYFLYVVYKFVGIIYDDCIKDLGSSSIKLLLITNIAEILVSSLLTIVTTIVFWKSYFIKYKNERVFGNLTLKAIAAAIVLTALIALTLSRATYYVFTLTTSIALIRRFESEKEVQV